MHDRAEHDDVAVLAVRVPCTDLRGVRHDGAGKVVWCELLLPG